jgi:hypothetical protein
MRDVRAVAAAYGVAIELVDLGDWGRATLVAEYDPQGPTIRVNARAITRGCADEGRRAIDLAIGHELYHHREAVGEVERVREHRERERAADAFAQALVS